MALADDGEDELAADELAFGLAVQAETPGARPTPIWPENEASAGVFFALTGQWKTTPTGGLLALDYGVIPAVLEMMDLPRPRWRRLFADLRTMEREALRAIEEAA